MAALMPAAKKWLSLSIDQDGLNTERTALLLGTVCASTRATLLEPASATDVRDYIILS